MSENITYDVDFNTNTTWMDGWFAGWSAAQRHFCNIDKPKHTVFNIENKLSPVDISSLNKSLKPIYTVENDANISDYLLSYDEIFGYSIGEIPKSDIVLKCSIDNETSSSLDDILEYSSSDEESDLSEEFHLEDMFQDDLDCVHLFNYDLRLNDNDIFNNNYDMDKDLFGSVDFTNLNYDNNNSEDDLLFNFDEDNDTSISTEFYQDDSCSYYLNTIPSTENKEEFTNIDIQKNWINFLPMEKKNISPPKQDSVRFKLF